MHTLPTALKTLTAAILLATATISTAAHADVENRTNGSRLQPGFYAGIGFGASWLNPDTTEVPTVNVNDRVQKGAQVTLGRDFNKWMSLELNAAELGSAGFSPVGEIHYQTFDASALMYLGKNRHRFNRRGLTAFARLGYGALKTQSKDIYSYRTDNSTHLLVGAGIEFVTRTNFGVRLEGISYDGDFRYGQAALTYRFGKEKQPQILDTVEATPPAVEPMPVIAAAIAEPIGDSDNDKVNNDIDQCPNTAAGAAVSDVGCALFAGVIDGVQFKSGSHELTEASKGILQEVVATLEDYPQLQLDIAAHTDAQGDASYNMALSERRAGSVQRFLESNGIAKSRLNSSAFGESNPIADNSTAAGRLANRRVELFGR